MVVKGRIRGVVVVVYQFSLPVGDGGPVWLTGR